MNFAQIFAPNLLFFSLSFTYIWIMIIQIIYDYDDDNRKSGKDLDLGWMVVLIVEQIENFYQLERSGVGAMVAASCWQEWLWS